MHPGAFCMKLRVAVPTAEMPKTFKIHRCNDKLVFSMSFHANHEKYIFPILLYGLVVKFCCSTSIFVSIYIYICIYRNLFPYLYLYLDLYLYPYLYHIPISIGFYLHQPCYSKPPICPKDSSRHGRQMFSARIINQTSQFSAKKKSQAKDPKQCGR